MVRHNTRELLYLIKSLTIHEVDVACKAGSAHTIQDVSSALEDLVKESGGHAVSRTATNQVEEGASQAILGAPIDPTEESKGHAIPGVVPVHLLVESQVSLMDSVDATKKGDHHPASDPPPAIGPTASALEVATKKADHVSDPPPPSDPTTGTPKDQLNQSVECSLPWWKDLMMPLPLSWQCSSTITGDVLKPKVVVLDMNGVLLKRYKSLPKDKELPKDHSFTIHRVKRVEFSRAITCIV